MAWWRSPPSSITYRVTDRQGVEPAAVWAVEPPPFPAITLITCVPDGIYSHRLIVRGEPV